MTTLLLILCTLSPFLVLLWPAVASAGKVDFMGSEKKAELWHWYRTSGAECIHHHEGAWTDPNPLYYGGFQANEGFAKGYGKHYGKHVSYWHRYGPPNHWPRILQVHMARHGYNARGWYPWPNTARACGLL